MQTKIVIAGAVLVLGAMFLWALHGRYYVAVTGQLTAYEVDRWTGRTWWLRLNAKTPVEVRGGPREGRCLVDWAGVIYVMSGLVGGIAGTLLFLNLRRKAPPDRQ